MALGKLGGKGGMGRFGSLAGAGRVALAAPFGFAYSAPFTVYKSGVTYSHSFSMDAVKPTPTVTLYCGAGGSNANNGTSWALRVRSLKQLVVLIQAQSQSAIIRCLIQTGTYAYSSVDGSSIQDSFAGSFIERNLVIEPCDSSGNVVTGGTAVSRRIISLHDQTMPAFSLVSSGVYVSTFTTQVPAPGCYDLTNLNSKSNPQALRYAPPATTYANEAAIVAGVAAQATAFGHGACYIDATNSKYYVKTFDGRAPDANIIITRGGINTNGANARNLYLIGPFGATQTVWARDLHLWGGAPLYAATQWSSENRTVTAYFADCSFNYSCINGYNADGAGNHTLLRCTADDAYKDGYNYDQATGFDAGGTAVMRFNELDCTADWNGNSSQGDDSDNGSSCHVRTQGVRVNVVAKRSLNRAFHDIAATQTWNLGCIADTCRLTGNAGSGAFATGFPSVSGSTAKMWLDGCQSINNDYDLEAYQGASLYYANMNVTGFVNQTANGGTINTYNSPPVLPGATGTLSASAIDASNVQLTFTAASGAVSYEYRINGGSNVALAGTKIVTGLTQLTAYNFEVRAVNTDGYGVWSNVASATTPASATPTDILLNGNFAGGTTSWGGFGFSGKSVTGGKAVFAATGAFDGITQSVAPTAGKYYELTWTISGYSAGTVYAYLTGGTGVNATTRSANGTYVERILVNSGNNNFGIQANAGPATLSFDDVTLIGPYNTATVGGA